MTKSRAWNHYFKTGEREPLIEAYWDSIKGIAWNKNILSRERQEDAFQWGMIGLLKAIDTIDRDRVKSKDAWVWLNVSHMMDNHYKESMDCSAASLDEEVHEGVNRGETIEQNFDIDLRIDLISVLVNSGTLEEAEKRLDAIGIKPVVTRNTDHYLRQYRNGDISISFLARELGISRRQAHKLVGKPRKN